MNENHTKFKEKISMPIRINPSSPFLYTWGFSKYGQTGIENSQYTINPTLKKIPLNPNIKEIFAGEFNSGFITNENNVYLFGKNSYNTVSKENKNIIYSPKLIPIKLTKISIGGEHVLGLSKEKNLFSWGFNFFGQLGLGHNENVSSPTHVEKFGNFDSVSNYISEISKYTFNEIIVDVSAGAQHSLILTNNNNIYACGFSKTFALGFDYDDVNIFTKINKISNKKIINKINAGVFHSGCVQGKFEIVLWGKTEEMDIDGIKKYNLYHVINNVENNNNFDNNLLNDNLDFNDENFPSNSNSIKDLQIGENFLCILTSNGKVFTFGDIKNGVLTREKTKRFENVIFPEKIEEISVGYNFVYVLSENKYVYCWGDNKYGQITNKEKNFIATPILNENLNKLIPNKIACGGNHCLALCRSDKYEKNNFYNISLNQKFKLSSFNLDISTKTLEYSNKHKKLINEIHAKNEIVKQLTHNIEEKEKIKKEREKNNKKSKRLNNSNSGIINPTVKIETLLNEEIKLKELTFPENCYIGTGAFGDVKLAYWRKTLVAVKFLKSNFENKEEQVIPFIEEFNLLKSLRHPNILLYIGGCISGPQHFLVTEYCEYGNLFEFLHNENNNFELTDIERLNIALEIAQGINYLHSFKPPILHRDLKSLNILLDSNFEVKICDFGWARLKNIHMTRLRGTFQWMAPEVILKENYTEKADVYSFGIILWELWSKDPPYKGILAKDVANLVKKDKNFRPKIPEIVPDEISDLMKKCWDYEPQKRPSFNKIINYIEEYMRNMD